MISFTSPVKTVPGLPRLPRLPRPFQATVSQFLLTGIRLKKSLDECFNIITTSAPLSYHQH